jgi:predicted TIM-barrel fold metal-dependent hydrolase
VWLTLVLVHGLGSWACAQPSDDIRELRLADWEPRSMLKTTQSVVEKPAYPVIDVHNHLGTGADRLTPDRVKQYLDEMDAAGVRTVVNLDGQWGQRLAETLAALDEAHPGRFLTFALWDFGGIDDEDWGRREAARLEESFQAGAKGLKIHKSLGLSYRYKDGKLMPVDDPKLDPVWEMCAKYQRPVMIHTSDPAAFFTPLDRFNERWHELNAHPNWLFHGEQFPSRDELLAQRNRAIAKHPNTTFICAHFGNNPEDVATVGTWLDRYSNMYIDIDARISELGRQPYTTRRFLLKYQDRIMFGTDTAPDRDAYRMYYRFLETDDEYFDCGRRAPPTGFLDDLRRVPARRGTTETLSRERRTAPFRSHQWCAGTPGQGAARAADRRFRRHRPRRRARLGKSRVGAAAKAHRRRSSVPDHASKCSTRRPDSTCSWMPRTARSPQR